MFSEPIPQKGNEEHNTGGNRRWYNGFLVATQEDTESEIEVLVNGVVRSGTDNFFGQLCSVSTFQPLPPAVRYMMQFKDPPKQIRDDTGLFFRSPTIVNIDFLSDYEGEFEMPCVQSQTVTKSLYFKEENVFLTVNLFNGPGQGYHSVEVSTKDGKILGSTSASLYGTGISSMCIPLKKETDYYISCTSRKLVSKKLPQVYHCSWIGKFEDYSFVQPNLAHKAEKSGFLVCRLFDANPNTSATVRAYASYNQYLVNEASEEALLASNFVVNNPTERLERFTRTITVPINAGQYYCAIFEFAGAGFIQCRMLNLEY